MRYTRGLSLIEVMVVLVILAILAMIAVPHFTTMLQNGKVTAANNALLGDLNYARTEAILRGSFVAICPSTDGSSCATSTAYDQGWIVYPASGIDVARAATDPPVLRYSTQRPGVSIQSTVSNGSIVTFGQQGRLDGKQAQLPANSYLTFVTCIVISGTAQSTATVPGIQLQLSGIGNPASTTLAAGTSCSS